MRTYPLPVMRSVWRRIKKPRVLIICPLCGAMHDHDQQCGGERRMIEKAKQMIAHN